MEEEKQRRLTPAFTFVEEDLLKEKQLGGYSLKKYKNNYIRLSMQGLDVVVTPIMGGFYDMANQVLESDDSTDESISIMSDGICFIPQFALRSFDTPEMFGEMFKFTASIAENYLEETQKELQNETHVQDAQFMAQEHVNDIIKNKLEEDKDV